MKIIADGAKEFHASLMNFIKFKGITVQEGMRFEGRQLMIRIIQFTPPQKGMAQGRQAVSRDIQRAIVPISPNGFKTPRIRKLVRSKNLPALTEVFKKLDSTNRLFNTEAIQFDPGIHQRMRDRRGRVTKQVARYSSPDYQEMKQYIKDRGASVGQARGGWSKALEGMGGRSGQWYGRWKNFGVFIDGTKKADPFFDTTNQSRWSSGGDQDRVVDNAMKSRVGDIARSIENALAKASAKAGLD